MENQLCRKTIKELIYGSPDKGTLPCSFYIPSYQRGYRWKPLQVKQLIDEIMDFRKDKSKPKDGDEEPFYCLQPLVVKRRGDSNTYEVIDGQQRLTTIYIIILAINEYYMEKSRKKIYDIDYATRDKSDIWSEIISDEKLMSQNIDYFHIHKAYIQADISIRELEEIKGITDAYSKLAEELLDHTQVIWYEVDDKLDSELIDVFDRLNRGKIPLTNAELIKAMILQARNFEDCNITMSQTQIATDWDNIEKTLQQKEFWAFIYDRNNPLKYETRIEYIFDLMSGKNYDKDEKFTFNKFYEEYTKISPNKLHSYIHNLWIDIKNYFYTFEEWYNNRAYFHYIGYLVECGISVSSIKSYIDNKDSAPTKKEFNIFLVEQIKKTLQKGISKRLTYGKKYTSRVLLLFNIQTLLDTAKVEQRFPFHLYKNGNWDIEHIASNTEFDVNNDNKVDWAADMLEYFLGVDCNDKNSPNYINSLKEALDENLSEDEGDEYSICYELINIVQGNIDTEDFEATYNKIKDFFEQTNSTKNRDGAKVVTNKNFIYNLAILNSKINRSYGNAMFPIKRQTIIKEDARGVFVPLCTKNVFHKVYSRKLRELMFWNREDALSYLDAINNTLAKFLPSKIEEYE